MGFSRFSRFTRPSCSSVNRRAFFRQFAAKAALGSGRVGLAAVCTLQRSQLHPLFISAGNRGGAGDCENTGFRAALPARRGHAPFQRFRDPPNGRRHTLLLARSGGTATLIGERLPYAGAALLASSSSQRKRFELLLVGRISGLE